MKPSPNSTHCWIAIRNFFSKVTNKYPEVMTSFFVIDQVFNVENFETYKTFYVPVPTRDKDSAQLTHYNFAIFSIIAPTWQMFVQFNKLADQPWPEQLVVNANVQVERTKEFKSIATHIYDSWQKGVEEVLVFLESQKSKLHLTKVA